MCVLQKVLYGKEESLEKGFLKPVPPPPPPPPLLPWKAERRRRRSKKPFFHPAGEAEAAQLHGGESLSCEYEGKERLYVEEGLFFVDWRRGEQKMVADQPPTSSIFTPNAAAASSMPEKSGGSFWGGWKEAQKKGKGKVNDLSPGC